MSLLNNVQWSCLLYTQGKDNPFGILLRGNFGNIYYSVSTNYLSWYSVDIYNPDENKTLQQLNVKDRRYGYFAF